MKIYSMTATFGKLLGEKLTLQPGLNIIEGPNEWGKSTWCAFLTAMLYGIDTRERTTADHLSVKEHYAPWSGAPMAGRIDLNWNGRDITIERRTRGRTPFGEFAAYETASGLPVAELTADNCGKLLLGAEKSVFTRSGFIRLTDMPVTQDDALRRRLNDLVTTGDDSGQSDDLAQKLRDLKNKVRANRANGLIPQALAQKQQLEDTLRRHDDLQHQTAQLQSRHAALTDRITQLQNHKQHLAYQAAQGHAQRAAQAKENLQKADAQVQVLEKMCENLPTEAQLMALSAQARELNSRKDALQLEIAMLPAAPAAPQGVAYSREQAHKDFDTYQELSAVTPPAKGLLIGICTSIAVLLAGIVLEICNLSLATNILGTLLIALGAVTTGVFAGVQRRQTNAHEAAQQLQKELSDRYAPLSPDRWVAAAEEWTAAQAAYAEKLSTQEAERTALHKHLQQILQDISALPGTEEDRAAALALRRQLNDALRERQHLQSLVQTLESTGKLPPAPTTADSLTYPEADTARLLSDAQAEDRHLTAQLGNLAGQTLALGSREETAEQLSAVNARLEKLYTAYAALELAQNTLAQANTELQRRFAPQIAQAAQENFRSITGGRYDRLTLSDDLTVHTAAADEPAQLGALWRSDGTADQLYLSLRLAVSQALTPEAPLVLDDALARFDDTRLAAAMALLRDIAAEKQILLFTCHTRERTCGEC